MLAMCWICFVAIWQEGTSIDTIHQTGQCGHFLDEWLIWEGPPLWAGPPLGRWSLSFKEANRTSDENKPMGSIPPWSLLQFLP